MGNKIKFKRGIRTDLPNLDYGEPAFVSDEGELYIGTQSGNIKLTNKSEIENINTQLDKIKSNTLPYISLKMFGANGNGKFNNKDIFPIAIQYCVDNDINYLIIEKGIYYTSVGFETKGVTLIGQGYEIPFMTWDYTRPNGTDDYEKYKSLCKGSVITTDKDITLITDGLKAENIGFFGNKRMTNQHCVSGVGGIAFLEIKNVGITGFGGSAIYFPQGVINPTIEQRCEITQNYIGIEFGIDVGNYTGETNRITIRDSSFNRSEKNGIFGKIQGRHIIIKNNKFECIGEPSDSERSKPTSVDNICYGIDVELYNTGGWTNGSINLEDNYLEETYGFAKIIAKNPVNAINIKNNEWYPYDQTHYSNFICFDGYISNLNIEPNNVYTSKDYIYFKNFNVRNFNSCLPVTNGKANINKTIINGKTSLDLNIDAESYIEYNATKYEVVTSFPAGFITSCYYDRNFTSEKYFPSGLGCTYFIFNPSLAPKDFDFGVNGMGENNINSGYGLIVDNTFVAIVSGYSSGSSCFNIRGDRSNVSIGNGSAKLVKMSSLTFLNGGGRKIKPVFDWDNTLLPYGK